MIIDVLIILLFFILRLPLQMLIDSVVLSEVMYRILADTLIIILLLLLLRSRGKLKNTLLGWHRPRLQDPIIGILIACILLALSLSLAFMLPSRVPFALNFNAQLYRIYILFFITSTTEELFYRGFLLLRLLEVRIAPLYAVTISALVFGLSHVYLGTESILFSTMAGMLLGYAVVTYRSISMCVIAHFSYNVIYYTLHVTYNM